VRDGLARALLTAGAGARATVTGAPGLSGELELRCAKSARHLDSANHTHCSALVNRSHRGRSTSSRNTKACEHPFVGTAIVSKGQLGAPLVRVLLLESFGGGFCCELEQREGAFGGARTRFRKRADVYEIMRAPSIAFMTTPTIERAMAEVPHDVAQPWIARLSSLAVRAGVQRSYVPTTSPTAMTWSRIASMISSRVAPGSSSRRRSRAKSWKW